MNSVITLSSGAGSTVDFFLNQIKEKKANFIISAVITDNPKAGVLKVAKKFDVPVHIVKYDKTGLWDEELLKILLSYKPSLILLAGFLKKIGPKVLQVFSESILNSHPALLPEFGGQGMYGLKVHSAVLKAKKKQTGVSIHFVNSKYDEGAILAQKSIPIEGEVTAKDLERKVKQVERVFYFETVKDFLNNKIG